MLRLALSYLLTSAVFFAIDLLWLGVVARGLYQRLIGDFLGDVNWGVAIAFYLIFIAGLFVFAIVPAVDRDSAARALLLGALFGFFTYATYDLTNLATLRGWPVAMVLIDIPWGMTLAGVTSLSGYYILRWLSPG